MKTVAFVPIRLNSKRIVGKNLMDLGGRPLMCHILDTLLQVQGIDQIYAYCSSESVIPLLPAGVQFLKRSTQLDLDTTLGAEIYDAFTATVDADIYMLVHTTSPFIKAASIQDALDHVKSGAYDSSFSALQYRTFTWFKGKPLNYDLKVIPRTQTLEPVYIETSSFFIFKSEVWKQQHQRIGDNPYIKIINPLEGVDIDYPEDLAFAQKIFSQAKQ